MRFSLYHLLLAIAICAVLLPAADGPLRVFLIAVLCALAVVAARHGRAYEQLFEWKRAAEEFQLACRLDGAFKNALVALARLQACCPLGSVRDGKNAVGIARHICALTEWKDWVSLSILAAAYAETGDFQSAIWFARQAAELAPESEKETRLERVDAYEKGVAYRLPDQNSVPHRR